MRRTECPREQDTLDAVASRRWPERADADLRDHVSTCAVCADLIEVAATLAGDHELALAAARVPLPAAVWWKAQVRARQEAVCTAARPIAVVHGAAAAAALALAASLVTALAVALWPILPALPQAPAFAPLAAATWERAPLVILVLVPWLVLAPVAAWLALARE